MSLPSMRLVRLSLPLIALCSALHVAIWTEAAYSQGVSHHDVRKLLGQGAASAQAQAAIKAYLSTYFSQFQKPDDVAALPNLRKEFANMVRNAPDNPAHRYLNDLTYSAAMNVVKNKQYSIAARYNAMLLIADLNQSDAVGNIKPYPPAFSILKAVLGFPPDHDYAFLKPAALVGITRIAQDRAIPPEDVASLTTSLLTIVNNADPPPGRSGWAHNFLRRSAAGALAMIGTVGPDNAVPKAFEAILMDPNTRPPMRCEMMQFLGDLNYPPDAKDELKRLANLIGHQTVEICRQELDRATTEARDPSRRMLMYAVYSGKEGLRGMYTAAASDRGSEAYGFIAGVGSKINSLYRMLDDTEKTPDNELDEKVSTEIDVIRGELLAKPAAPTPLVAAGPPQEETAKPGTTN